MAEAEIKSVACKCGNFSFTFPVPQVAPDHKVEAECPACGAQVIIHPGPGKKGGNS